MEQKCELNCNCHNKNHVNKIFHKNPEGWMGWWVALQCDKYTFEHMWAYVQNNM